MNIKNYALSTLTALALSGTAQAVETIDVLVLYTDEATQTQSGRDIDARIASYVEYSNQAYTTSGADIQLRLVGSKMLAANYKYVTSENLSAFANNAEVTRLRQEYGADLVTLLNLREQVGDFSFVCGVGYVAQGNSNTGKLYSYASSAGFSLVGVNCGLSTFTHELGHNQSLGHSPLQNSEGGVWDWSRGYGVQGVYSTIMAYPHAYGTRNQLARMSNSAQSDCERLLCGKDISASDGADATLTLNRVGSQVAAFMPEVNGGGDPDPDPTDPSACSTDVVDGNLINDGDMSDLNGWTAILNASAIEQHKVTKENCVETVLKVTDRTAYYGNAYQEIASNLKTGVEYHLKADLGLMNAGREEAKIALRITQGSSIRYEYLPSRSISGSEMTSYAETFVVDGNQPDSIGLIFYGPSSGVDFLMDNVSLVEVSGGTDPVPPINTVAQENFEGEEVKGWKGLFGTNLALSPDQFSEGAKSLRSSARKNMFSGPAWVVSGLIQGAQEYTLNAQVRLTEGLSTENVYAWVYYVDDQGGRWQQVASTQMASNKWNVLNTSFTISASGSISQAYILIAGPSTNTTVWLDDASLIKK